VTGNVKDFVKLSSLDQDCLETLVVWDSESNIHSASIFFLNCTMIVSVRSLKEIVKELTFLVGEVIIVFNTTLEVHISLVETHHVDAPDWWGVVVSTWGVLELGPVHHHWSVRGLLIQQTLLCDDDGHSCGSHVLLGSGVDNVNLLPVDWSGTDVG